MKIYDHLLQFPLFQGMSHDDLAQVAGHTKFGFLKVAPGQVVASADTPCTQLFLLLTGTIQAETCSDDRSYSVTEQLQPPYMLQPEAICGYTQRFTHTFTALTESSFITIGKEEVARLSQDFLVFRLNLLGIFATQSQKLLRQPWHRRPATLSLRIVRFLVQHTLYPAGPKTFHIRMRQLADELGCSRLEVSTALNQLQDKGCVSLHRGRIVIPRMELLLM